MQHRDTNKIQAVLFMQRLYIYLLVLRYVQLLAELQSKDKEQNDNAETFVYDVNGRGSTYTFQYDNLGRRIKLSMPNGAYATYTYDSSGRLTNLTHKTSSGSAIDSFTYALDKVGNKLTKIETNVKYTYTYDAIYRLLESVKTNPANPQNIIGTETYTYDPVGNRLAGPKTGDTYTYNQANELTASSSSQYTYDRNGNLIKKIGIDALGKTETWTYTYDYENRLVRAEKTGGLITVTVTFKYDPFARRIEKKVERKAFGVNEIDTHTYVYDNEDMIIEYIEATVDGITISDTARYIHGPGIDEPLAMERWGKVFYYHADGLGSTTALTDAAGRVVKRYSYDSFGNMKITLDPFMNPYTYTGREWDWETGLYYYRARYYDPKTGRFISFDPIVHPGNGPPAKGCSQTISYPTFESLKETPQKLNPFVYVENRPIILTDPYGLFVNNQCYWGCMLGFAMNSCGIANAPCLACLRLPPPANTYCVIGCSGIMTGLCIAAFDDTCTKLCCPQ